MFGVKVYSVVVVLSNAGAHVPVIPLVDVIGKALNPKNSLKQKKSECKALYLSI